MPIKNGFVFLNVHDIVCLQAEGSYTEITTRDKSTFFATHHLKDWEAKLPPRLFFRCHQSHLINMNSISKFYHTLHGYFVLLENGKTVEISRRKKDEFLLRMGIEKK